MAAMVGLQFEGASLPVGDQAVITVVDEAGQLVTGRGLHRPDDEPDRGGIGRSLEGGVSCLGQIGVPSIQ